MRCGRLIVRPLDFGSSGLGPSPGHVVFLVKYHLAVACGIVAGDNVAASILLCPQKQSHKPLQDETYPGFHLGFELANRNSPFDGYQTY